MADHLLRIIIQAMDKASGPLGRVGGSAERMGAQLRSVGASMTRNVTLPILAIGVAAVKAASDMDTAMRNVQSVGKQTDAEIRELSTVFGYMASAGSYGSASMTELATAFYDIQGAGFAGADAMLVLQASSVAATAGAADLTATMEGVTAVLNSYGKGADEAMGVADLLFRVVDRGVGSMEELAGSLSSVVGVAAAVGVPMEEVGAAIATLTKQGFDMGEATTALNQVFLAFLKPSTALQGVIENLGYTTGLAMIQEVGFANAVRMVSDAVGGNAASMSEMFGAVRGIRGALALTGDAADMFAEDLVAMGDANGAATAAMRIQMRSFANQAKLLKNALQEMMVTFGNIIIPVLIKIINHLRPIIYAFTDLPPSIQEGIVIFLAFAAALGPVLWIVGSLITVITGLGTVLGFIPAVIGAINIALLFLAANPIVLVIAAIVALGVGIALLINHFGGLDAVVEKAKEAFGNLGTWIKDTFFADWKESLMTIFFLPQKILIEMFKGLPSLLGNAGWNAIKGFIAGLFRGMAEAVQAVSDFGHSILNTIKSIFGIASPSEVMAGIGANVGTGFSNGLYSTLDKESGNFYRGGELVSQSFIDGVYAVLDSQGGDFNQAMARFGLAEDDPIIAAYYEDGESLGYAFAHGIDTSARAGMAVVEQNVIATGNRIAQYASSVGSGISLASLQPGGATAAGEAYRGLKPLINTLVNNFKGIMTGSDFKKKILGYALQDALAGELVSDPAILAFQKQIQLLAASGGQSLIDGLKQAWGIASPSKVMMGLGKNLAGSLASGVETGAQPVGASASGGGVSISIGTLQVPEGTTRQQVDELMKELGRRMQQRGISGRSVG